MKKFKGLNNNFKTLHWRKLKQKYQATDVYFQQTEEIKFQTKFEQPVQKVDRNK